MEWHPVPNHSLAASLATFGIPFKTDLLHDAARSRDEWNIHFAPSDPSGAHHTKLILHGHATGSLPAGHRFPFLVTACENLSILRSGRRFTFHQNLPSSGLPSSVSLSSDPLPGVPPSTPAFRTSDIHAVAALTTLGCRPLHCEGGKWILATGDPATSPVTALLAQRAGSLSSDHLLVWILTALENLDALSELRRTRKRKILLRPPGSVRRALVPEAATSRQLSEARRFLGI